MQISRYDDYGSMSVKAAEFVANEIIAKPNLILGLPTGATPIGMYRKLIFMYERDKITFKEVKTFNLDEYYPIKRTSKHSYYKFMFDKFFKGIDIHGENINIPDGEAKNPVAEAASYEEKLANVGYADLMVLGVGANGHIGFNEPAEVMKANTHVELLSENTKEQNARFFNSADDVPEEAITMGMGSIMRSRKILLLVSGETKQEALAALNRGIITPKIPVTYLLLHRDVTVLTDI